MLVASNNLIGKLPLPEETVIRVNLAWASLEEAENILKQNNKVYLDYPTGRTKPPKPTISLCQAIALANKYKPLYFAVSNIEDVQVIRDLKSETDVQIVPKIETVNGVENIDKIAEEVDMIMLDKDDLYLNCKGKDYEKLIERVRNSKVKVLEVVGIIFQYEGK
jgi:hypothetical protein